MFIKILKLKFMWKYIVSLIFGLLFAFLGLYFFKFISNPSAPPGNCVNLPEMWVRPTCAFVKEDHLDTSIVKPSQNIYLGDFVSNPNINAGGGICTPLYYAFRYVRVNDGAYGPLSDWTTIPVQSGSTLLPCYPKDPSETDPSKNCKADNIQTGKLSCDFNQPTLVTVDPLDYSITEGYILNIHRQEGSLDLTSEGDIVGNLINSGKNTSNAKGWTSFWIEVLFPADPPGAACGC